MMESGFTSGLDNLGGLTRFARIPAGVGGGGARARQPEKRVGSKGPTSRLPPISPTGETSGERADAASQTAAAAPLDTAVSPFSTGAHKHGLHDSRPGRGSLTIDAGTDIQA